MKAGFGTYHEVRRIPVRVLRVLLETAADLQAEAKEHADRMRRLGITVG